MKTAKKEKKVVATEKKDTKKVAPKSKPELISYSMKMVIPTGQYANIQPEIVVKAGTVVVPLPGKKGDEITLYQENTYNGIMFYLGTEWETILNDVSYEIWFTGKERYTSSNAENLFDIECTVTSAAEGTVQCDMDASDTDIVPAPNNYRWQIQIKKPDDSEVKTVLSGRLIIEPTLLGIEVPS